MTNTMMWYREILAWHDSKKPGTIAKTFRKGDTGHGVEDYRQGMIRDGEQAGTGDFITINNSPMAN